VSYFRREGEGRGAKLRHNEKQKKNKKNEKARPRIRKFGAQKHASN
jgi:hypothetical protein